MNIKFEYMYRDYGNYKKFNEVIFTNLNNLSIKEILNRLEKTLFDGLYFKVGKVTLPDLHFKDYDDELDHNWHEFNKIIFTEELPTDKKNRDIQELLDDLIKASKITAYF